MSVPLHTTGKASFDDIYASPDPRAYYARMSELGYCIPQLAQPYFAQQLDLYRQATGTTVPTVLDIGCSYGVNAALSRLNTTMEELSDHYRMADSVAGQELIAMDRARLAARNPRPQVRFIGMDAAQPALAYAQAAGFLHDVVHADLEAADPTEQQRAVLAAVDMVISTGCVGYITGKTLVRVVAAHTGRPPWMAHFVLRMFGYDAIASELAALGYTTTRVPGEFAQRRFASDAERARVLNTLQDQGIDPTDRETEGWLYANLYLSRPAV